ncbi:MAG TPA: hypothetical protein VNM16_09665, partial [Bacillota bacterium]|nr:hypothetical protein [Bacillota bacterium]
RQRMERLAQDHFSQVGHGEYGRFQNTATGVPMGGVSSWTTTGTNYGTSTGFGTGTGTGAGTGTSSNYGSGESRYDWNRGESTRNLPEWVREPTRR